MFNRFKGDVFVGSDEWVVVMEMKHDHCQKATPFILNETRK